MSYFAVAVVRGPKGWAATDLDLSTVSDVEDAADRLRDVDLDADVSLLFVEIDDQYLALLRLDEGEDLRVFGSDSAMADDSRLGSVLVAELESLSPDLDIPDPESDPIDAGGGSVRSSVETQVVDVSAAPDIAPVGDIDLLNDLGVPSRQLLDLCAREATLPADITTEICETLGCSEDVEELRE